MTPQEEAVFDKKVDKHFRGHRGVPKGRNFTCWNHTPTKGENDKYRKNFDKTFPNAPGAGM